MSTAVTAGVCGWDDDAPPRAKGRPGPAGRESHPFSCPVLVLQSPVNVYDCVYLVGHSVKLFHLRVIHLPRIQVIT